MLDAACVSDLQDRVRNTRCPSCDEFHLQFLMRCDLGTTECLLVARCDACATLFNVDFDSFPSPCARCHQELELVTLSCSSATHACRYVLQCPRCSAH